MARELRPGVLDDLGLVSALAALTNDFSAHSTASVRRGSPPACPPLPPEVELVVYRVAQEALTNAPGTPTPRHVELSLTRLGDHVVLEVADDGRGCARPGAPVPGVRGMRERALLVQGQLRITSRRARRHGGAAQRARRQRP